MLSRQKQIPSRFLISAALEKRNASFATDQAESPGILIRYLAIL